MCCRGAAEGLATRVGVSAPGPAASIYKSYYCWLAAPSRRTPPLLARRPPHCKLTEPCEKIGLRIGGVRLMQRGEVSEPRHRPPPSPVAAPPLSGGSGPWQLLLPNGPAPAHAHVPLRVPRRGSRRGTGKRARRRRQRAERDEDGNAAAELFAWPYTAVSALLDSLAAPVGATTSKVRAAVDGRACAPASLSQLSGPLRTRQRRARCTARTRVSRTRGKGDDTQDHARTISSAKMAAWTQTAPATPTPALGVLGVPRHAARRARRDESRGDRLSLVSSADPRPPRRP